MTSKKNILVAPLNWGLGHATRCIPIINKLIELDFNPILASDGEALRLLQKEFPNLKSIELPSYNIKYPKNGNLLKWKLLLGTPRVLKIIKKEKRLTQNLVESENLIGIISDNRFGVRSYKIPSVFITHQLNVFSGNTTYFSSKLHQTFINKFDECWIPDLPLERSFSKKLSHSNKIRNQKFIGFLSRFTKKLIPLKYNLLVLLSGIEPLRNQLEKKLISELQNYSGKVLFVKGIVEEHQKIKEENNIIFYNYLLTNELETAINESKLVLARSGYSTIMDLAILGKKAFFIPTTGQYEQEYLAKRMQKLRIAPYSSTKKFKIKMLSEVNNYNGFNENLSEIKTELFDFFKRK
ncbi:MAG: glycosyltransferase [Flavobacteriaceae bacterium]|nr:glycosyltransferase [Flavobacteriaceae bacterium]